MQITTTQNKPLWQILIGGTIGNLTEWYNFLLFGYLAPFISQLFFPSDNELLSISLVFVVFAISFLVRPLGGILFGWIGDTYGRQRALLISLFLLGIPTFLIGILPTYQTIGIASPILLCLLRICQGLSAGGEHTGSAIYVAEYAPPNRRALWVSTVPSSAALGVLTGSLASLIIISSFNTDTLLAYGWRTGYWAGTFLCLISILLRLRLPETPDFEREHRKNKNYRYPIKDLIRNKIWIKNLFIIFSLASAWGVIYQLLFIWMPTYLTHIQHFNRSTSLQVVSIYIFILSLFILFFGLLADYFNRKYLLMTSSILLFISAYPLFMLLSSHSLTNVYVSLAIFTVLWGLYIASAFVIMVEKFPPAIRYTGLSFGFNLGLAIFGGTCPLIATWLIEITDNPVAPAFYLMLAAGVATLTCMVFELVG